MSFYADLHVHSRFARACSRHADLRSLSAWALKKGIGLMATGDFTHPIWRRELRENLEESAPGLFRLKPSLQEEVRRSLPASCQGELHYLFGTEVCVIYKKDQHTRKIHHLLYVPGFEKAEALARKLKAYGDLEEDGRPNLSLDSQHLLELLLELGEDCYLVPAHVWTPWFGILGSKTGFSSIEECFGDLHRHIFAAETGLSSDPGMNWQVPSMDRYQMVSYSDAHSPPKLGREASIFDVPFDYAEVQSALKTGRGFEGTLEFFPEEGKYHLDGHRACGVRLEPSETEALQGRCPVCKRKVTKGVLNRMGRDSAEAPRQAPRSKPFRNLLALEEILAELEGLRPAAGRVQARYEACLAALGPELAILDRLPLAEIAAYDPPLAEGIARMREGRVLKEPGYDGLYGKIRVFPEKEGKTPRKRSAGQAAAGMLGA